MKIIKNMAAFLFAVVLLVPLAVSAQTNPGGSGLSISPTRFEFVIERGQAELATIQVKNVTDDDIVARAFLNDFEPDGNTGNPRLIIDSSVEQSSNSIREFVVGLEDVPIKAGETAVVKLPVQVPDNASPGAYYGAIRFTGVPVEQLDLQEAQLALNASVAALVLVEVPGDITEKIEINSVSAYLDDDAGSLFTRKPNFVGIEVNNLGNGFSKPFGRVTVSGPWGAGEVMSYELNDTSPRGNVLPDSARLFKDELTGVSRPGRYTIQANISHSNGGEVLTVTSSFWYLPSWFLLTILGVILLLAWVAFYLYRKYVTKTTKRRRR